MKLNNKGMLLMMMYFVIAVLLFFVGLFAFKNLWEARAVERYKQTIQAFHAAEAGMDAALARLPSNTASLTHVVLVDNAGQTRGVYSALIDTLEFGKKWRVESQGFVPDADNPVATRHLEAYAAKSDLPDMFWENAIYTAGDISMAGTAYDVTGDVIYAGSLTKNQLDSVVGDVTNDPSISPLFRLDFELLRTIALSQTKPDGTSNLYDSTGIKAVETNKRSVPTSFWYDEANGIPNIVYYEGDLKLRGNSEIGGFIIVVGDVITNPDETSDAVISGTCTINGCLYTLGEFRIDGGGSAVNVDGGIWSGSDGVDLNGNITVTYNGDYMDAIRNQSVSTIVQLISWREVNI